MRIYVDADACPVVRVVEEIAKKYAIPVLLLCDTNHVLSSDYSEIKIIEAGADAVDFALVNLLRKGAGDIVVTQDYGVAAMALGKGAYPIHQSGKWYTNENINQMLMERHLAKKARNSKSKHHLKGPKKRTEEDDLRFAESFEKLIDKVKKDCNDYRVIRKEIRFEGSVQGVGFRYRAQYAANGCGVTGWVRNEMDGSVLMEAQGTNRQINEMLKLINQGSYIRIDRLDYHELPVDENERGFHIR